MMPRDCRHEISDDCGICFGCPSGTKYARTSGGSLQDGHTHVQQIDMIKKDFWKFRKYLDCHIHLLAIAKSLSRDVNFLPPGNVQLITNNHASMSARGVEATASGKSSNKRRSSWCSIPPKRLRFSFSPCNPRSLAISIPGSADVFVSFWLEHQTLGDFGVH